MQLTNTTLISAFGFKQTTNAYAIRWYLSKGNIFYYFHPSPSLALTQYNHCRNYLVFPVLLAFASTSCFFLPLNRWRFFCLVWYVWLTLIQVTIKYFYHFRWHHRWVKHFFQGRNVDGCVVLFVFLKGTWKHSLKNAY